MQSTILEPRHLPELPAQSPLAHWVYESPLPLSLVCIAIGIALFVTLRRSSKARRFAWPSIAFAFALSIGVSLLGWRITTPNEELEARSKRLVEATATGDSKALSELLDEQVRVQTAFGSPIGSENVIRLVTRESARAISSARVSRVNSGLFGPRIAQTQVRIKTRGEMLPTLSWWTLDWTRPTPDSSAWVVTHIEPLWIQGLSNPAGSN